MQPTPGLRRLPSPSAISLGISVWRTRVRRSMYIAVCLTPIEASPSFAMLGTRSSCRSFARPAGSREQLAARDGFIGRRVQGCVDRGLWSRIAKKLALQESWELSQSAWSPRVLSVTFFEADLPDDRVLHGLRKAAARRLSDAGLHARKKLRRSLALTASESGHRPDNPIAHDRKKMRCRTVKVGVAGSEQQAPSRPLAACR